MLKFHSQPISRLVCGETGKTLVTELGRLDPRLYLRPSDWPKEVVEEHVNVSLFCGIVGIPASFRSDLVKPLQDWVREKKTSICGSTWSNANKTGGLVLDGALKWHTDTGKLIDIGYDMLVLVSGPSGTGTQFSHSAFFADKFEMRPRFCAETDVLYYVTGDTIHRSPVDCPEAFRIVWRWVLTASFGGSRAPIDCGFDANRLPSSFLVGATHDRYA